MKLSGGLGELEILEMVKVDFCILCGQFFSSKICFETLFVEYILPIYSRFEHTCVAYDKALAKYVVNTANLNATIADNTPRWNFFHFFLSKTSSIYTWPVTNACLTCLPYWFASKTCLMWPWACSNSLSMWPHVTSCDPCDVPICPTFSTFYNLVFQQRKFNMLWTL